MNTDITAAGNAENLFLGETFEESIQRYITTNTTAGKQFGALLHMGKDPSSGIDFGKHHRPATASKTGWFVSQDPNSNNSSLTGSFDVKAQEKLFRISALAEGEWLQKNYQIGIEISRLGSV